MSGACGDALQEKKTSHLQTCVSSRVLWHRQWSTESLWESQCKNPREFTTRSLRSLLPQPVQPRCPSAISGQALQSDRKPTREPVSLHRRSSRSLHSATVTSLYGDVGELGRTIAEGISLGVTVRYVVDEGHPIGRTMVEA